MVTRRLPLGGAALAAGCLFVGFAVVGMHFSGMAAMRAATVESYDPQLTAISAAVAVAFSGAGLWLALRAGPAGGGRLSGETTRRGGGAALLGAAIAGMHYLAMAGTRFTPVGEVEGRVVGVAQAAGNATLGWVVGGGTLVVCVLALVGSAHGRRLSAGLAEARALQEGERRYRALAEAAPDFTSILDPDGTVRYTSPSIGSVLGYGPEERVGKSTFELVHPDDAEQARRTLDEGLAGGHPRGHLEHRYRHKDGSWRWLETTGVNLLSDPDVQGVVVASRDVTERKRAEEALKEAEARYRTLVEQIPVATYTQAVDHGGKITYVSPQIENITGYTPGDWVADPGLWVRTLHPDDRERVLAEDARTDETCEPYRVEHRLIAKDGRIVWARNEAVLVRDEDGHPLLWQGVVSDVTERKEAERALRESEERFRSLTQNSSDIITVIEPDGIIRYESPAIERILGWEAEELVGEDAFDHIHPDDRGRALEAFLGAVASGDDLLEPIELRFRRADGSWRWLEVVGNNLVSDPAVGGAVLNSRDVTERREDRERLKQSEEAQRRRARELDLLHRVRTALARELDPGAVCRAVVDAVADAYGYALVSAYLIEGGLQAGDLVLQHQVGYETVLGRIPAGRGVMWRAVRSGRSVLIEDALSDPDFLNAIPGLVSEVCVPLFDEDAVVGTLNAESTTGVILDEDDLRLLEAVGEHAGTALGRARLYARAREAEERYRALVENIPAVVYIDDADESNSVIYRSPHVREVLGYEPEEFLTGPEFWQNLLHPDDRERVLAENEKTNETGEPFRIEYRMIRKDGRPVWLRDEAFLIRDENGHPKYWQGYFADITERKEAEARLREAEEKYRTMVEGVPAITYVFSQRPGAVSRTDYISPQVETVLGYAPEEYAADPAFWETALHPEDRGRVLAEDMRTGGTGEPFRQEFRMVAKDGSVVWLRDEGNLVRVEPDGTQIWHGVMYDISELKEAEAALRESEERFRALVQNASDVVLILDPDGAVRYVSPSVERVLGDPPEERVGKNAFGADTHPDDATRLWNVFAEGLARPGGVSHPLEFRARHRDGSWRHLEAVAANRLGDPAVRGIVVNARDVTERKAYEERLEYEALHDPLTGLPNRALFLDRLSHALARGQRRGDGGTEVAVLFMDLDNFKYVNDSFGHETGDRLLVEAAGRLRRALRPSDTAARLGGDEFVVLLEDVEGEGEAADVAWRVADALSAPFVLGEAGHEAFVTASVGVALGRGTPGHEAGARAADLLRRADLAMYEAKGGGKARHAVFDPESERRSLRRLELENGLRRALEREELVIFYQPVITLGTGRTVGFEALVRWKHPERGLSLPEEFVPLAEELGLTVPMGRWVLKEACRQAREWQDLRPSPIAVSVNISARQISHPGLVAEVEGALAGAGLDPACLTLEIVEDAVAGQEQGRHVDVLRRLRSLGVHLAMDDFGTGYSSLSHLKRLPVGTLKIDRSFVEGIGQGAGDEDEVMLSGVIGMARGLGMRALAEGVETAEQASRLRELGCDLAQGFLFSPPLPAEAATEFLRAATEGSFDDGGPTNAGMGRFR